MVGRFARLHIDYVSPLEKYLKNRQGILESFDQGIVSTVYRAPQSSYFRSKAQTHGRLMALRLTLNFFRLFRSFKNSGFLTDQNDLSSFIWVFCSEGKNKVYYRMDGHHRASVARYLGMEYVPVILITPKDVMNEPDLPSSVRRFLEETSEPVLDIQALDDRFGDHRLQHQADADRTVQKSAK